MDSRRIDSDSTVDMVFHLKWKSDGVDHTDGYQASRINIWRDYIPPPLLAAINGKQAGERFEMQLTSNAFDQNFAEQNLFQIKSNQFDPQAIGTQAGPARWVAGSGVSAFLSDAGDLGLPDTRPLQALPAQPAVWALQSDLPGSRCVD